MKDIAITQRFTNRSNYYLLLGDTQTIILAGTKEECEKAFNTIEIGSSKYGGVEVVAPGESVESDMLVPVK